MEYFHYKKNEMHAENVPVSRIAREAGTPFYLYSRAALEGAFRAFDGAFKGDHLTCYSVKANSNRAVLALLAGLGSGADVVSGGELRRALAAGIPARKIVFSGTGKTADEIDFAIKRRILLINVESPFELDMVAARAKALKKAARIALRINPDVDPKTHPYIATGLKENKFGIDVKEAHAVYRRARDLTPHIDTAGMDCHFGSQLVEIAPFEESLRRLVKLLDALAADGLRLKYFDFGGGLGIRYRDEKPPSPAAYARVVERRLSGRGMTSILEPGRAIVGNAGVLVCRVIGTKTNTGKKFVIVDGGMNDLIRPALYGSYHEIQPVVRNRRKKEVVDVVGPVCESADFFARGRKLQPVASGDLLAVMGAGAYGFTMVSTYNSRPYPAEVMADRKKFEIIRKRGTFNDLVRGERVPSFLK